MHPKNYIEKDQHAPKWHPIWSFFSTWIDPKVNPFGQKFKKIKKIKKIGKNLKINNAQERWVVWAQGSKIKALKIEPKRKDRIKEWYLRK